MESNGSAPERYLKKFLLVCTVLVFIFHHKPKLHVQFLGTPREGKNFLRLGRHVFNFCA